MVKWQLASQQPLPRTPRAPLITQDDPNSGKV
jgi:hypothetical protein